MGSSTGGVRVIEKAGALMEALAYRGPQTVVQLAEATGEPRTTIYRLLATLQEMGWVEETSKRGRYALGLTLMQLGRAAVEHGIEHRLAAPVLRALRTETGLTVYLHVLRGLRAVCVERIDGRELLSFGLQFGGSLPLHAGAGARVLLAFGGEALYQRWRETVKERGGVAEAFTQRTPRRLADIEALVQKVRTNGFAVSSEDNTIGIAAIGAPIWAPDDRCLAAVSIAGSPEEILNKDRQPGLVEVIRRAAQQIGELSAPRSGRARSQEPPGSSF
ncbi:IclR family transcriptional regulator [Parasphingorhabdus pacifica]